MKTQDLAYCVICFHFIDYVSINNSKVPLLVKGNSQEVASHVEENPASRQPPALVVVNRELRKIPVRGTVNSPDKYW